MRQREFIAGLGSAATCPVVARAQQPKVPVVGLLNSGSSNATATFIAAFRQGLKQLGYTEGQDVEIAYCWADG
jgi:putative tryptophan/tyrosine transport system substrate-binding protein